MTVFFDTNVLLDWLLDRQDNYANEATLLIEAAEQNKIKAYMSAGSVYTIAYVLERAGKKGDTLRSIMQSILLTVKVKTTDTDPYITACSLDFKDLEDAFQYAIASQQGNDSQADYFVTGNLRDFYDTTVVPVVTPRQMLALIK
jgi:predicted nucleic acid-binding protein